jgi:hypothetical protein
MAEKISWNSLKFSKLSAKNRVEVLFLIVFSFLTLKTENLSRFFVKLRFMPTLSNVYLKIKIESIDFQALK